MKRTFNSFTLTVVLMLLALPVIATPGAGAVSPRPSIVATVKDAFSNLWRVVAPAVAVSPGLEVRAKGDDDDNRGGVNTPPLSGLGSETDPWG